MPAGWGRKDCRRIEKPLLLGLVGERPNGCE
jgi:hypothetical protein